MWGGLFATGSYMNHQSHRNFWTASWELISRFTWQLPQTMIGHGYAQFSGYAGQVDNVDYWGGATVMSGNNWGQKAVTLSSFIIGDRTISADPNNSVFQHEYGHYLQSQSMGWGYLSRIGIPSLMSADGSGNMDLHEHPNGPSSLSCRYHVPHSPVAIRAPLLPHWRYYSRLLRFFERRDRLYCSDLCGPPST